MDISRSEHVALLGLGFALVVAAFVIGRGHRAQEPVVLNSQEAQTGASAARIRVHVVGEVTWPGQYLLSPGARVQDAVLAAHGPTTIADLNKVNLAAPLRDGDRVVIPRIVQPSLPAVSEGALPRESDRPSRVERAARQPPAGRSPAAAVDRSAGQAHWPPGHGSGGDAAPTVNVNTATAAELERLPGIGPVLARRIVEHREAKGLFRRLDDLLEVKGIGPKLLRRIQPWLRLDDGTEPARHP